MGQYRLAFLTMPVVMVSSAIFFANMSPPLRADSHSDTAQQTVQKFYKSYLAYLEQVASLSRSPRTADRETATVLRPYFTTRFQNERAKLMKYCGAKHADVPEECDGDSLICAQEPPTWARVASGDATSVSVELCFNCEAAIPFERHSMQIATATVKQVAGHWRIDGIGCSNPDARLLNGDDLDTLARRAATGLKECAGLERGAKLSLAELSNRTDEHVDKAALTSALQARLAETLGVALVQSDDAARAPALTIALTSEKSDSKAGYVGVYRLELKLTKPGCSKTASLEKRKAAADFR